MKNKLLFLILAILIISSCSEKENVPNGIIPPPEMAHIITKIYNAEHKVGQIRIPQDSSEEVFRHFELMIYEDHSITDSIYKKSFRYYLEHPEMLESIYDIVIDSLSIQDQIRAAASKKKKSNKK